MFKSLKYKIFLITTTILLIFFIIFIVLQKKQNNFIKINLITSTHTDLPWKFKSNNPSIDIKIGELTNIEYTVKNLSDNETSGVASFAFHPKELEKYIIKIECFCYDVQTIHSKETRKFVLTMMIDPKVTKDTRTKPLEEAIMQFVFFDSKNFNKKNINK